MQFKKNVTRGNQGHYSKYYMQYTAQRNMIDLIRRASLWLSSLVWKYNCDGSDKVKKASINSIGFLPMVGVNHSKTWKYTQLIKIGEVGGRNWTILRWVVLAVMLRAY